MKQLPLLEPGGVRPRRRVEASGSLTAEGRGMARVVRSEIRDNTIRDLLAKVKDQKYGLYLRRIKLVKARAFVNQDVNLDFPVTALIGTNGGGKSTVLGAAAIAHKIIKPGLFFPKSSIGDDTMQNWSIGYDIIAKEQNPTQLIQRRARFKNAKWARDDVIEREVLYFPINRTVPAGERREFKKLATVNYKYSGSRSPLSATVVQQAARILGKDMSHFEHAKISETQDFYVGSDGTVSYSEFHFGAGESSVIRMVRDIENAKQNALILIEEIENGLHPLAVRSMVDYLMEAAQKKAIQTIFTTHSEDALLHLPSEAIWSSIDGRASQGRVSIEALRTMTGRVDEKMVVFVEDPFAKDWVESILRTSMPERMDEIGVYSVFGDGKAKSIHLSHRQNPSITTKSLCILDGDSLQSEDEANGVIRLPGQHPESEVFNFVAEKIDDLAMQLAVALHLTPEKEGRVKEVVEDVSRSNRDPHLLFSQVGQKAGLISETIVASAFIGLWMGRNQEMVASLAGKIAAVLDEPGGSKP